ncbi:MAG TPA: ABZJ_00895 family protein [Chitinolyticbacter sp.]|nr:ABZJ_00895 family protein [Chitinolyticbacter sp.]
MSVIFSLLPTAAITPAALLTGLLPQGCGAIAAAAVAAWMFGKQQSRAPTAREATQFALWKQCMQLLFSAAVAMLLMGSIQKIVTGIALTLQYSHMYAMYYLVGLVAFVAEFFIARWFFLYFARRQASVAVPAT